MAMRLMPGTACKESIARTLGRACRGWLGGVAIGLTGCTLEPPYQPPSPTLPTAFASPQATESAAMPTPEQWWTGFGDPQLQSLLDTAVHDSPELRVAIDRVMVARDGITVARSNLYPILGFSGLPTDPLTQQLRTSNSGRVDVDSNIFELSLDASYEVDLWGRVRSQVESSNADYRADAADAGAARIGLLSAVASRYFELRELDEKIALAEQQSQIAAERLRLTRLRLDAGRLGAAPVDDARLARNAQQADLARLQRERSLVQCSLALLVGSLPEQFHVPPAPLRETVHLQAPPAGLPSTLLQRRPDLVAAEAKLQASHAQINIAHSDLMPQVALTGKLGFVTGAVHNLLAAGSTVFGIGPDFSLPIFNAGRLRAQLDASRWEQDQTLAEYRRTLLAAFGDVDHALVDYQAAVESGDRNREDAVIENAQLARIESRLAGGHGSRFELLDSQQRQLERESLSLHAYHEQLDGLVALYQALGGGWTADDVIVGPVLADRDAGPGAP